MHELDVNDSNYDTRLQTLSMEVGAVASEATLLHGSLRADVFAQLTPEQRELAAEGRRGMRRNSRHGGFFGGYRSETESSESE